MSKKLFAESTATPQATGTAGRWRAVLLTPGTGSSGAYSEAMLKQFGSTALKKGAKSFVTHNRLENGEPDPFQMWGVLAEDAYYEDGVGLVGEIEVLPSWRDRVEEVAPHTALSVYVMGEADEDGNVTKLFADQQNGVDMVVYPGRPGSGLVEKLFESAKAESDSGTDAESSAQTERKAKENMDEKLEKLTAVVETLVAKMDAAETARATEAAEAQAKATAEAEKFDAFAAVELVAEAGLSKALHASVIDAVKNGNHDVAGLVTQAKAIQESVMADLAEDSSAVRIGTPAAGAKDVAKLGIFGGAE